MKVIGTLFLGGLFFFGCSTTDKGKKKNEIWNMTDAKAGFCSEVSIHPDNLAKAKKEQPKLRKGSCDPKGFDFKCTGLSAKSDSGALTLVSKYQKRTDDLVGGASEAEDGAAEAGLKAACESKGGKFTKLK
jgi:hypothetical protein